MERLRELVRYRKSRHLVRVRRSGPGCPYTDGYVVGVGDELVAMHAIHDFRSDGFEVFPLARVTRVETSARDVFWQTILECEGEARRRLPLRLQLGDARALMTSLARWGQPVGVHHGDDDGDAYAPGIVHGADETGFDLRYFSAGGVWDDELTRIAYADLLRVDVVRPYIETFARYLLPPEDDL